MASGRFRDVNDKISAIIRSQEPISLLGDGDIHRPALDRAIAVAPILVAADGAAKQALAAGQEPVAVIGDLDSLDPETREALDPAIVHEIVDQDTTDFDKCLRRLDAPMILGVGFLGARIDHELAAFNALVRHADRPCILVGRDDICFHLPARMTLRLPIGLRLSLFPMQPVRGTSRGLRWPIDGIEFAPSGRIGTSNEVTAPEVELAVEGPGMLAIMPPEALDAALAGFGLRPPARGG